MINTIITDVGGVLIKNYIVTEDIEQRIGLPHDQFIAIFNDVIEQFGSGLISEEKVWQTFHEAGGNLVSVNENILGTPFKQNLLVYRDVLKLFERLKKSGYQLAILSNTNAPHEVILTEAGVYSLFGDHAFLSHKIGLRKPNKEAFTHVLQALAIDDPSTVLFIDDQPKNIPPARELGIHTLLVEDNEDAIIKAINDTLAQVR